MKYELYGNEDGYSFLPENHSQKELIPKRTDRRRRGFDLDG